MNYKLNLNLLALRDAVLCSMPGPDGAPINGIFIPAQKNDAYISFRSVRNPDGTWTQISDPNGRPIPSRFSISMNVWQHSEAYRKSCQENPSNLRNENYIAPSHKVILSLRKEHEDNLVAQMKEYLRNNSEFIHQHPNITEDELMQEARNRYHNRFKLADLFPTTPPQQQWQAPDISLLPYQDDTAGSDTSASRESSSSATSLPSSPALDKAIQIFDLSPDEEPIPFL